MHTNPTQIKLFTTYNNEEEIFFVAPKFRYCSRWIYTKFGIISIRSVFLLCNLLKSVRQSISAFSWVVFDVNKLCQCSWSPYLQSNPGPSKKEVIILTTKFRNFSLIVTDVRVLLHTAMCTLEAFTYLRHARPTCVGVVYAEQLQVLIYSCGVLLLGFN